MTCVFKEYEIKTNGTGVMNTAEDDVFIGLSLENCYLVAGNLLLLREWK